MSFLQTHYNNVLDNTILGEPIYTEGWKFRPQSIQDVHAWYLIINDIDNKLGKKLWTTYQELRKKESPPIPDNIILSET